MSCEPHTCQRAFLVQNKVRIEHLANTLNAIIHQLPNKTHVYSKHSVSIKSCFVKKKKQGAVKIVVTKSEFCDCKMQKNTITIITSAKKVMFSICLFVCLNAGLLCPTPRVGTFKQWCTSDVSLSVAYIGHKLRTERPRKTKIGTEVVHVIRDSDTTFKVKGQLAGGGAYCGGLPQSLFNFVMQWTLSMYLLTRCWLISWSSNFCDDTWWWWWWWWWLLMAKNLKWG